MAHIVLLGDRLGVYYQEASSGVLEGSSALW